MTKKSKSDKNDGPSEKADWINTRTEIFLKVCIEEVNKGNRPSTSFSKIGWENIVHGVNTQSHCNYSLVQIKNKWTEMKKEWDLYRRLCNMTEIGWYEDGITIRMDPDWWKLRIEENKDAKKFKDKAPLFHALQEELFDPVINYSQHRYTPNYGIDTEDVDEYTEATDSLIMAGQTAVGSLDAIQLTDDSPSANRGQKRRELPQNYPTSASQKKHKGRRSNSDRMASSSERWASATETYVAEKMSAVADKKKFSIENCIQVINSTLGIVEGNDLWMCAMRLIRNAADRQILMLITSDEARVRWILEMTTPPHVASSAASPSASLTPSDATSPFKRHS